MPHSEHDLPTNGEVSEEAKGISVKFADFVSSASRKDVTPEINEKLRHLLVDWIGVTALAANVADSSAPFLEAVKTLASGAPGTTTVVGSGIKLPKQYAALMNGAYAHSLDFDDTHQPAILHPGASIIATILAEVEGKPGATLNDVLLAMAVGYETACRLGVTMGRGQWERGSHNTATVAMFGCIASLASLRKYDSAKTLNAFGIATSFVCSSLQFLVNGAWNKRLHPGYAAHNAFVVTAFNDAGVIGAVEPIEGRHGLVKMCSSAPIWKGLADGLGTEWRFMKIALKPYPACRWTHGEIELAGIMSAEAKCRAVKEICVTMDTTCFLVVGERVSNKLHPRNIVDAQFSVYYQIAAVWLYGSKQGWSVYDRLDDPEIAALAEKITVETKDMKFRLNSSLKVVWEDGTEDERFLEYPLWEPERPASWSDVCTKFESIAPGTLGGENTRKILEWFDKPDDRDLTEMIELLA